MITNKQESKKRAIEKRSKERERAIFIVVTVLKRGITFSDTLYVHCTDHFIKKITLKLQLLFSQHKNTNSKDDFVLKNWYGNVCFKYFW